MTLSVQGQVLIDVDIEGLAIPTSGGTYPEVRLQEGIGDVLPTALLTITDGSHLLNSKLQIVDGTKVTINIRKDDNDPGNPEVYRIFSRPSSGQNSPGVQALTFTLILDAPKWYARVLRTAYEGPSFQVIKDIAEESELEIDLDLIDYTVDNQVWQCLQQTAAGCAYDISLAGYISDTSCMGLAVRANRTLFYRDLMQIATGNPKATFSNAADREAGQFDITQIQVKSDSGLSNNLGNYGMQTMQLEDDGQNTIYSEAKALLTETDVPINSDIKNAAEGVRVINFKPQNAGNTGKNYAQASYQNQRLLMMFCEKVSLITSELTDVTIGDCVELIYYENDSTALHPASGLYVVSRKTRVCRNGNMYGERFDLNRHQVDNEQGPTKLADEEDTQVADTQTTSVTYKTRLQNEQAGELKSASDLIGLLKGSTGSIIDQVTRLLNIDLSALGNLSASLSTIHPIPTVDGLMSRVKTQFATSVPDLTAVRALQVMRPSSLTGSLLSDLGDRLNLPLPSIKGIGDDVQRLYKGVLNASDFDIMGRAAGLDLNVDVISSNFSDLTKLVDPNVMLSIKALNLNGYGAISALGGSVTESQGVLNALGSAWDLGSFRQKLVDLNPDLALDSAAVEAAWATQTTWFEGWADNNGLPDFLGSKSGELIQSTDELQLLMRTAYVPLNAVPAVLHTAADMVPEDADQLMDRVMSWAIPEEARNLGQTRSILARVVDTFTDWKVYVA